MRIPSAILSIGAFFGSRSAKAELSARHGLPTLIRVHNHSASGMRSNADASVPTRSTVSRPWSCAPATISNVGLVGTSQSLKPLWAIENFFGQTSNVPPSSAAPTPLLETCNATLIAHRCAGPTAVRDTRVGASEATTAEPTPPVTPVTDDLISAFIGAQPMTPSEMLKAALHLRREGEDYASLSKRLDLGPYHERVAVPMPGAASRSAQVESLRASLKLEMNAFEEELDADLGPCTMESPASTPSLMDGIRSFNRETGLRKTSTATPEIDSPAARRPPGLPGLFSNAIDMLERHQLDGSHTRGSMDGESETDSGLG
ncbi:MAG: hypothetical protein ACREPC_04440, partial [Stenotrophomonas sp.]